VSSDRNATIESVDALVDFLREGEKPPESWLVGTEHEKVGLRADDHQVVPYEGPRGVRAVLEAVAEKDGWQPVYEGENPIALEKERASITLEPGGQLELSGAPLRTIHQTCDEFHTHLSLMKEISEPLGLEWLGLGINPLYGVEQVPVMPKARYRIMREYLPSRGPLALDMMFTTATVQANFDYASEADMVEKLRMAMGISPIVSAIFANSSLSEGKPNGFATKRLHIWHYTDPDRCGLLPFVFEPDFGYRSYIEWALDIPMFFLVRGDAYRPGHGLTFRSFLEAGFEGERATCSLPALWKGLLYDAEARAAAWALVAEAPFEAREAARADVARRGLAAAYAGTPVLELARALADLSRAGLTRIAHAGRRDADETPFLDPIFEQLERGASLGEALIESWEGEWNGSVDRLIEHTRY
jgi:glutamate--cysteine ligase